IIGRDKKDLGAWWRNTHFQSYEGITMPGFPNMFSVPTPYSYNSLSFFTTIEAQMKHMERCLGEMQRRGLQNFEVTEEACTSFTEDMRRRVGDSIFVRGQCATSKSYYFNQHGEAVLLRPTSTASAMRQAGKFDLNSYAFS
ncbi:MAG: NAD(P)/FAD-dependent oxidoreductase, partial [Nevskiales bacterium]